MNEGREMEGGRERESWERVRRKREEYSYWANIMDSTVNPNILATSQ